jgi:hypothetical protein
MTALALVAALGIALFTLLIWSFKALPKERWQMLAAVPLKSDGEGHWSGRNLTYYGLFTANAYVVAASVALALLVSVGVPPTSVIMLTMIMLAFCVPASRIVATLIEGKRHTFTVAGAFFVGVIVAPAVVWVVNLGLGEAHTLPFTATLAAMVVAYSFGEGLGRLACISFGCCYGSPLDRSPAWVQRLLASRGFVFHGCTKKAVYEGHFEGRPLVPIQAITATVLVTTGLVGTLLFLLGEFRASLLVTLVATQLWRVASEFLRADDRGSQKISAYQFMSGLAVVYVLTLAPWLESSIAAADVGAGLATLWSPGVILFLQAMWAAIFLYTGTSEVTQSQLSFEVRRDRI